MCNYRHPGPWRVWKGGSDLQSLTPFPVDPLDRADPAQSNGRCDFEQRLTLLATFAGKWWLENMVLNNPLTLLATFAVSNSDFDQHSYTFGHFCFEVFARSSKSCPCAAGSPPGPILALEIAQHCAKMGQEALKTLHEAA